VSNEQMPPSPFSQLAAAAAQLNELYRAYRDAGFTEGQALYLVACASCGGPREQQ
jgi:mono/diheme cytochrome c family protein